MANDSRQSLRKMLRSQRSRLSTEQIQQNARDLKLRLSHLTDVTSASDLAGYVAVNGEMDVSPSLDHFRTLGKTTWLPIVQEHILQFAPLTDKTEFRSGQFNIPIPIFEKQQLIPAGQLEVVLVPLVAFDTSLNRLGMGGGFYDRSFSFRSNDQTHPLLIGVAHEFQRVPSLPSESWDIPMDIIVTESAVYRG